MNAIGKRRLLKLVDFLETADLPGEFDMGSWSKEEENGRPKCGTAACAMGWATTIPSFRRAGLFLNECGDPEFKGYTESQAAARFFGIENEQALNLFVYYNHEHRGTAARQAVARCIRHLIASEEKRAA